MTPKKTESNKLGQKIIAKNAKGNLLSYNHLEKKAPVYP